MATVASEPTMAQLMKDSVLARTLPAETTPKIGHWIPGVFSPAVRRRMRRAEWLYAVHLWAGRAPYRDR